MDISGVVLTKDGKISSKLRESLSFCDEIVVLKCGEIIDFSFWRNQGLKKAKSDWILFIDSDEEVTTKLKKEILSAIRKPDYNGFYLKRLNLFFGNPSGRDKVLRLARKNSGKWEREVHEVWKVKGKVGTIGNYLIHQGKSNLHGEIEKINSYTSLHAKANFKAGKRSNLFRIIFFPFFKLDQNLIEGKGFAFALLHSFHSFLAWSKLYIWQKNSR